MGFVTRLRDFFTPHSWRASDRDPADDRWYAPADMILPSAAGPVVTPATALKSSAVYRCVRLLGQTLGSLPLTVYERRADGGRDAAPLHPLARLFARGPNREMTLFEWVEIMEWDLELRGNGYSEILPGPLGAVDQLIRIHPDRLRVERIEDGSQRFEVRGERGAATRRLMRSEIFHLRGPSQDGMTGLNPIALERETFGMALAAQDYGGRFFRNDARPRGALEMDGKFKDQIEADEYMASWHRAYGGFNRHKTALLQMGIKYKPISMTNEDAQFLETRKYTDVEIARIFDIPPHKIGILDRATLRNIEQQNIEFVTNAIHPRCVRWEQAIARDLLIDAERFFVKFNLDALLRGDIKSRYEAYAISRNWGWQSVNEIRKREDMNPVPGGDELISPLNMAPLGAPREGATGVAVPRLAMLAREAAERVVRRELAAGRKAYKRCLELPDNKEQFAAWIDEFYAGHGEFVAGALRMAPGAANAYAEMQAASLSAALEVEMASSERVVLEMFDEWELAAGGDLARMVLQEVTP